MKLQLALDRLTKEQCFSILEETHDFIDWIEVGTGVIKEYGMTVVSEIKEAYPNKKIVADMKTCDAGIHEATQAFAAGADITTVMAFAADKTIEQTLKTAKNYKKQVMVDLLNVTDQARIVQLSTLGVDLVSLHFGKDMQQDGELDICMFDLVKGFSDIKVAVAGGINLQSLPRILTKQPDTVIVGSSITMHKDKASIARIMKGVIRDYENNY